jgi:hypothetical protein
MCLALKKPTITIARKLLQHTMQGNFQKLPALLPHQAAQNTCTVATLHCNLLPRHKSSERMHMDAKNPSN